ncbi:Protein of uncharacterised function (DUF1283) [Serratia rubidaea]|uniref:UPF0482 protein I5U13_05905 n=1 Tax=Serratia rubidaea TaxID=61652 RepID=A0A126VLI6_SERRU|nr:DUF1283 family protein [Serratia rubidaea]AML58469.1 putative secreted protein [Serratia rubidaea]MBD8452967.1 DUF1283 family protein [Serratia rubidaea]MBH1929198.1 DUF1283 family protein [Serratia rubidaea]MBS0975216.1 DUF1283 family protein [Serratia rubidaea]MCR0998047.1 DUF1283 family protein [Serratia rubidaea]
MKSLFSQRLLRRMLPVAALALAGAWQLPALAASCTQGSTCVTVDGNGGTAMSNENARQSKEQWNDTRSLRHKVNTRVEKDFDKLDRAADDEDRCNDSLNVNAYWEPSTLKCLDRTTGRRINP